MTFLISHVVASKHFPSSIRTSSDSASSFLSTVLSHYQSPITIPVIPYRFQNLTHPLSIHCYHFTILSGFTIHVGDSFYPASLCHNLPNSSNVFLYSSHWDFSLWHLWLHRTCHHQYLLCLQTEISRTTLWNDNTSYISIFLCIILLFHSLFNLIDLIICLQSITLFMFPILLFPKLKFMPYS